MKYVPIRAAVPAALSLALAPLAHAQGYVEKAAAVGLVHEFTTGLDRAGNWAPMCDWVQVGAASGDLDGDVDPDVVAVSRLKANHVFRNDGGTFTDVSSTAKIDATGFDTCAAMGDYDRDGDLDVFIGSLEHGEGPTQAHSRLYRNDGGFVLRDVTAVSGTVGSGHTIQATFVDLDQDGMLDLLTAEFFGTKNRYYRNEGDGSFSEISAEVGLDKGGSTHVHAFLDADGDGLLDVLVGNDWKISNAADIVDNKDDYHLRNLGDGTFQDVTVGSGFPKDGAPSFGSSTMGITIGDVDYDGDFDAYNTELKWQFLTINNGWPTSSLPWVQAQDQYGVTNVISESLTGDGLSVGWGTHFLDADLDPWLDLFKVNGHVSASNPYNQRNYFYKGMGPGGGFAFTDQTVAFGLDDYTDTRGISVADMDADGDLDFVTCPPADFLRYFENNVDRQGRGFVVVRPVCGTSAPGGFGVKASWTDPLGYPHMRLIGSDGTTAGQNEYLAHFGIGLLESIDLSVEFPSGMTLQFPAAQANSVVTATEPVMIELPAHVLPIKGSAAPIVAGPGIGGLTPLTGQVSERGFPVRVHAYAQDGTPLDGSASVSIEIPGLQAIGPVQHVSGNTFVRRFSPPDVEGRHRVEVAFGDFELKVRPTIAFRGALASARTTIGVVPEAVRAGSADTFDVVVVPRDSGGRLVGASTVTVSSGAAIPPTALTAVGDGSFRGTLPAPATAGFHAITAVIDGAAAGQPAMLDAGGAAFGATSVFYDEVPNPNIALEREEYKVLFTPRDLFGRRLGPKATVTLQITPDAGAPPVVQKTGYLPPGRVGGDFFFVLEKPAGAPAGSAKGSLGFLVDGVLVFTKPYVF